MKINRIIKQKIIIGFRKRLIIAQLWIFIGGNECFQSHKLM